MPGAVEILTYQDLIDHGVDYLNARDDAQSRRAVRRAILSAHRIFPNEHQWTYYMRPGRIRTNAPQSDGTITYDHSGHASGERILAITGDTWPSWARNGRVRISDTIYQVASRVDSTNLQLAIDMNPGSDIAAGTSYTLYRNSYPLPSDLVSIDEPYLPTGRARAKYVHPRDWHHAERYTEQSSSTWLFYTILGSRDFQNTLEMAMFPYPDSEFVVDFMYRRRMEPFQVEEYSTGTVTCSGGGSTVNGDGTAFDSTHVGAIIRFSENNDAEIPTGRHGGNPYTVERTVMSVTNGTTLTVDQDFNSTLTDVKYTISDPVDVEPGAMATALLRCLEREICLARRMFGEGGRDMQLVQEVYQEALRDAKDADSRTSAMRSVYSEGFSRGPWPYQLKYLPQGADVE